MCVCVCGGGGGGGGGWGRVIFMDVCQDFSISFYAPTTRTLFQI